MLKSNSSLVWRMKSCGCAMKVTTAGLDAFRELCRQYKAFLSENEDSGAGHRFIDLVINKSMEKSGFVDGPPSTQPEFKLDFRDMLGVVERSRWRRVWIIQEVILARSAEISCAPGPDDSFIPWSQVLTAFDIITLMRILKRFGAYLALPLGDIKMRTEHLVTDVALERNKSIAAAQLLHRTSIAGELKPPDDLGLSKGV